MANRRRAHAHICDRCLEKFPCDGEQERNYDGWPEVICRAFHVHSRRECEECIEALNDAHKSDAAKDAEA